MRSHTAFHAALDMLAKTPDLGNYSSYRTFYLLHISWRSASIQLTWEGRPLGCCCCNQDDSLALGIYSRGNWCAASIPQQLNDPVTHHHLNCFDLP